MKRLSARLVAGSLTSLAVITGVVVSNPGASAAPTVATFSTPGSFNWTVPAGVTSVTIQVAGAGGGDGNSSSGGLGGYLAGDFVMTPGDSITVHVGGAGATMSVGGVNGGGDADPDGCGGLAGGSGGGASDVRTAGDTLADRIIVAGGGGGGGGISFDATGGVGGGNTPTAGASTNGFGGSFGGPFDGGGPGSASAGGAGGGGGGFLAGQAGALGVGGAAGTDGCTVAGGGGGGYYGGGGGGGSSFGMGIGGGGGGSAYISPAATLTGSADGDQAGNGLVVIRTQRSRPLRPPRRQCQRPRRRRQCQRPPFRRHPRRPRPAVRRRCRPCGCRPTRSASCWRGS